ncbi:MAG: RsmB/NOP family class I SAM-dependent RNA methyltransferase [Saprospiraceae bacterium]|nr:RsmB/NOP family class I SAM-dependent RNA methyltransferase [Saprospiraceae bacterium]
MQLPEDFIENIKVKLSATEFPEFLQSLDEPSPTSIRIHPIKYKLQRPSDAVKWCSLGFYLNERPKFTLDPSFHAGVYYVQEASSMIIWQALKQITSQNDHLKILDLCAAPGGKSSLIASYMNNEGLLVCNEFVKNRAYTLRQNITKEGYSNIIISNNDPKDFSQLLDFFDIILIDAPCSGEGMFRKDHASIGEWSNDNVKNCCARQKRIMSDVLPSLKPGGHIIYSTCTYNDEENIKNMHWATSNLDLVSVPILMEDNWKTTKIEHSGVVGYQLYPHLVRGEGLFISILQKQGWPKIQYSKNKSPYLMDGLEVKIKLFSLTKQESFT